MKRYLWPVFLMGLSAGCGKEESASSSTNRGLPSVILVTLDTTRADRLGAYGFEAGTAHAL